MRLRNRLLIAVAAALVIVPVLLDVALGGPEVLFRYAAADAFYYHTVARNLAQTGVATFDLEHPTNGFHPLWQVLLALQYWIVHALGGSDLAYLRVTTLTCLALAAAAVVVLGRAMVAARGSVPDLFALLAVGAYGLLLAPAWLLAVDGFGVANPYEGRLPLYGTLWSFVNGMESSLTLFLFSALAYAVATQASAPILGLLCASVTLARLDQAYIAGAVVGWLLWQYLSAGRRQSALSLCAAFGTPLVAYLAINVWYSGAALPVSGASKSTFPNLAMNNINALLSSLAHPVNGVRTLDRFFRLAQIWIPALAMLAYVAGFRRRRPDSWQQFLLAASAGALVLAAYNFCFVVLHHSGQWYYPVSILLVTLIAVDVVRLRVPIVVTALISILVFVGLHRRPDYHENFANFYLVEAPALRSHYAASPPRVIEFDDGIFAFATGFRTMSGFGFMLDAEAHAASQRNALGDLALARGFDRMATVSYREPRAVGLTLSTPVSDLPVFFTDLLGPGMGEVADLRVELDYLSATGRFAVFRRLP